VREVTKKIGWFERQVSKFVWWQRDLPATTYWISLSCDVIFGGYGLRFLFRGIHAFQEGDSWSSLVATGNFKMPFVSVEYSIISGMLIIVFSSIYLLTMLAARFGLLNRYAVD